MIEADFTLISEGYNQKKEIKQKVYLDQLRKTEDDRNLPDRLKGSNNQLLNHINNNSLTKRTLSKFGSLSQNKTIDQFAQSVDDIKELQVWSNNIQNADTILTIKISDPIFQLLYKGETTIFSLVSINLSDMAIIKIVHGSKWSDKKDFSEIVFRRIGVRYYTSYMRDVRQFEFDQKTKKHYSCYTILFYDLKVGKDNIKNTSKGKKVKSDKGLRKIKMDVDHSFWDLYTVRNNVLATEVLEAWSK